MSMTNIPAKPNEHRHRVASSVDVASLPWVFTQQHPLDTASFINEAKRRGFDLDLSIMRELYRHSLIIPFVYVSDRRVGTVPKPLESEPRSGSSDLTNLRYARDRGRLLDLTTVPFRRKLRFEERREVGSQLWWNGLLYSRYQLLVLPELRNALAHCRSKLRDGQVITRLPASHPYLVDQAAKLRSIAIAVTALEARYLPRLDPEWIHLVNTNEQEWEQYRQTFDPAAMSRTINYPAEKARQDAEWLLRRAHHLDPVGNAWSYLMRRAPRDKWKDLKNDALLAMDYREAAEILLLFYEDLVDHGQAEPLPEIPHLSWHPLHERLSYRHGTLDQDLMRLGISPHPRVVLAIEGETERDHVPRIWKELDYPDAPELVRLLTLNGSDKDLKKVAALAAAPLIAGKAPTQQAFWMLIKPPTCLFISVDPEGQFKPSRIDKTKASMLDELRAVLRAQGVENPNPAEIDGLIKVYTWSGPSYEFAHFTDEELADGIMAVHHTINGWTRDELVDALRYWRHKEQGIKRVWESGRWDERQHSITGRWEYEVSKTELAKALWPIMKAKIDRCRTDADESVPEIVRVVQETYHLAQRWRYLSFILSEEPSPSVN